jgi:MFS family permease
MSKCATRTEFYYPRRLNADRIGCFCGAITVFFVGSRLGRKRCIYVGAVLQLIGAILQTTAFGVPQMIVGRIVWYVMNIQ